jgi:hypothetical protein
MKKIALLAFLIVLCPLVAHAQEEGKFTRHYADSKFVITEDGRYSVEMLVIGDTLKVGMNSLDLVVHDSNDHDVMGAEVEVTPWMPEMGHGVKEVPVVTDRGGGLYSAENVEISMPGMWQIRVKVNSEGVEDSAVFHFANIHAGGMMHHHEPTATMVPEGLNISRIVESDEGMFRVTWMSDAEPVPVNKVHGWRLYIETADGMPVTDAEIKISGDMPEHGHGLPTKPKVSKNLGSGVYVIQGMKFQMPGWWVMNFTISSGDMKDTVTFNMRPQL